MPKYLSVQSVQCQSNFSDKKIKIQNTIQLKTLTCESSPRSQKNLETILNWGKQVFGKNVIECENCDDGVGGYRGEGDGSDCGGGGEDSKEDDNHVVGDDVYDEDGHDGNDDDKDYTCLLSSALRTGRL